MRLLQVCHLLEVLGNDHRRNYQNSKKGFVQQDLSSSFDNFSCDRYLKLQVNDKPGVVAKISTLLANNNLSIDNLIQKELERSDDQIPLVIVLSNSDEMTIQETIKELESLDEVSGPLTHIRILDI